MKKSGASKSGRAQAPRRRSPVETRLFRHWREFVNHSEQSLDEQSADKIHAATERFRAQVVAAAAAGVEASVAWLSLGLWSFDPEERLICFGRMLKCMEREEQLRPSTDELGQWTYAYYNAFGRFEIARALVYDGRSRDAKVFLEEALSFARAAEDMPVQGEAFEGNIEGKIAGELLLLKA
jgi:hypothetical protein